GATTSSSANPANASAEAHRPGEPIPSSFVNKITGLSVTNHDLPCSIGANTIAPSPSCSKQGSAKVLLIRSCDCLKRGLEIMDIVSHRQQKDQFFKTSPYSPLTPEQQMKFDRLSYYDPNPALVFDVEPEVFAEKNNIRMQTSTGDVRDYQRWGKIKF